jgi:hypothetical protein
MTGWIRDHIEQPRIVQEFDRCLRTPDVHKPVAEVRMRSTPSGTTPDDTAGEKLRTWARGVPAIAVLGNSTTDSANVDSDAVLTNDNIELFPKRQLAPYGHLDRHDNIVRPSRSPKSSGSMLSTGVNSGRF